MKHYNLRKLQARHDFGQRRYLVGIDPAKARHQAQIIDKAGLPVGSSFSLPPPSPVSITSSGTESTHGYRI